MISPIWSKSSGDECINRKESMDGRWNEKMKCRVKKDTQIGNLYDMAARIIDHREVERIATESRPGMSSSHHLLI